MGQTKHRKKPTTNKDPQRISLDYREMKAILDRTEHAEGRISAEDLTMLKAIAETLAYMTMELGRKGASIRHLQKLIFGPSSEKTDKVFPKAAQGEDGATDQEAGSPSAASDTAAPGTTEPGPRKKRKGHGRNGASDYVGAQKVTVALEGVHSGDPCPNPDCDGKLYLTEPKMLVRITGTSPFKAIVYELEQYRCRLCNLIVAAKAPVGIETRKYDESVSSMVGLFCYSAGLPFHRIEQLQKGFGVPLPASTAWGLVLQASYLLQPAADELARQAAQGEVLHKDDTHMKVLNLPPMPKLNKKGEETGEERTGVYTSGIVAKNGEHTIALFYTGHHHAGENLAAVLAHRAQGLPPPIHMCDALSHNTKGIKGTRLAHCLAHARRRFVDEASDFPEEVEHVLQSLGKVFHNDSLAAKQGLSPEERLAFHLEHSQKVMDDLKAWMEAQINEGRIEPNSGLGKHAIAYTLNHWVTLTTFLREPGAPIQNNITERALKKSIIHRKNSWFYLTKRGAKVGDTFMSLIHTAELNGANPFDYLVALQVHAGEVRQNPGDWMPWNYRETLARKAPTGPSPLPT